MVIEPLNGVFFCFLLAFVALAFLFVQVFKKKSEKSKTRFLVILYLLTLLLFVVYKTALPLDEEYIHICDENWGGFSYWNELPLNPCNIMLLLMPVAARTRRKILLVMCFFTSFIGPTMALLMPISGFSGVSLFLPRALGYYVTHVLILIAPILLFGLKIYRPCFRDVIFYIAGIILIAFVVFLINILLRKSGLCPAANYFFCMDPDNNAILMFFFRLIPIPFLYVLPCSLLMVPACLLLTALCKLGEILRDKIACQKETVI